MPFDEYFIERHRSCQMLYDATGAHSTPTLVERGAVQIGFDAARLLAALQARS